MYCDGMLVPGQAVPTEGFEVAYKHGGDNFSYVPFGAKEGTPCEQYILILLLPGLLPNSTANVVPLGFAHGQQESRQLMTAFMQHIDPKLPREPVTINGLVFTFKDYFMGDRALADYIFGHQGVAASFNCLRCWHRFGPLVKGEHVHCALPVTRT